MSNNQEWAERQQRSEEDRRAYELERLNVWALDEIYAAMERSGQTKADLARKLGTSRANITQIFAGSRNLTLRTLVDLAWACDIRLCLKSEPLRSGSYISSPALVIRPQQRMVHIQEQETAEHPENADTDMLLFGYGS